MTHTPPGVRLFRWLRLFHVTLEVNIPAIRTAGLLPRFSRGAPRVWLADFDRLAWAVAHVRESHGWSADDLGTLYVTVPSEWLVQARPGVYWCPGPIAPEYIGARVGVACQYIG